MGVHKKASGHDKKIKTSQSKTHLKETSRHAIVGAPAQPKQSSRKGKRAWRKNVNITTVEEGLEELREEERITG
jgi:nucleolar protein 53